MKKIQQGINVLLMVNDIPVGGQQNISLNRYASSIDITNRIQSEWKESLSGLKTWSISCQGVYIINEDGFNLLENAFLNNLNIDVIIHLSANEKYKGKAIITSFPLSSSFNSEFRYSIDLSGDGALEKL